MKKRALISVSDKTNCIELARFLQEKSYEILSTGGTYNHLLDSGIQVTNISEVTHFPEILDGRVKTLHPMIHAGILAKRNDSSHLDTLKDHRIQPIDMVVVNLYPFFEKAQKKLSTEELAEFIDIGGPTMLRAAAKSFFDVITICEISDYERIKREMNEEGEVPLATRKELAAKVFNLTAAYDAAISAMLLENENYPKYLNTSYKKQMALRYRCV